MTETRLEVSDAAPEFSADEVAVSHSPVKFIIDYKSITPRLDMHGQDPRHVMKHSIIKLDPHMAKEFAEVLADNIKKYEAHFGKIEKPASIKKAERSMKRKKTTKEKSADYFG